MFKVNTVHFRINKQGSYLILGKLSKICSLNFSICGDLYLDFLFVVYCLNCSTFYFRVHLNSKQKVICFLLSITDFYCMMANSLVPLHSHTIHVLQMPSSALNHPPRTILQFLFIHHMHLCSRY